MKNEKVSKKKKYIIITLVSIVSIVIGLFAAMAPLIMDDMVNKHMDVEIFNSSDYGVDSIPHSFITEDELNIVAWEVEVENPKGIVILLSGMQGPSVTSFFGYSKLLRDNNYASLLIEMRGHGDSEGDRVSLGIEEILDVKAGVDYIKSTNKYKDVPLIVWGTSMGGVTAINAIGELADIDGIISCSAYSSWEDVFSDNMISMGMPSIIANVERPFLTAYMGFSYGFGNLKINPMKEIKKLNGRPALIAHSTEDTQIPYASFERLIEQISEDDNIEVFVREGDEHFIYYDEYFDNPEEDIEFTSVILSFLNDNFD